MSAQVFTLKAVGTSFGTCQQRLAELKEYDPVYFLAQPSNEFDPLAIGIYNSETDEFLGWIGRNDPQREMVREMLTTGEVHARALVVGGYKKWNGEQAPYGLRVQFCSRLHPELMAKMKECDDVMVYRPFSGKHPTNRYEQDKRHKAREIRIKDAERGNKYKRNDMTKAEWDNNSRKFRHAMKSGEDYSSARKLICSDKPWVKAG